MQNKKLVKLSAGITAIALSLTLTSGCDYKKRDKFYFYPNLRGEMVLNNSSYISIEYINDYYVIELYNKILDRTSIHIAYRYIYTSGNSKYINVFTNNKIAYEYDKTDNNEFINITPLIDYLTQYNLIKDKYTYNDMELILEMINSDYKKSTYTKKLTKM